MLATNLPEAYDIFAVAQRTRSSATALLFEMDRDQAIELLLLHSCAHPDFNHPKWESGFIGMLRPFGGELIEDNYHEVVACIGCLAGELQSEAPVDKRIVSSLWGICHTARAWGVEEDGMLRRNRLISDEQVRTLDEWVDAISYATTTLLDGEDLDSALAQYRQQQGAS